MSDSEPWSESWVADRLGLATSKVPSEGNDVDVVRFCILVVYYKIGIFIYAKNTREQETNKYLQKVHVTAEHLVRFCESSIPWLHVERSSVSSCGSIRIKKCWIEVELCTSAHPISIVNGSGCGN